MPASSPPPQPDPPTSVTPRSAKSRSHTLEATGLLIVAVIILIITLVRYGRHIAWSAR